MSKFTNFFKKFIDKKTLKFLAVGVLNTLVGMGIMLLLDFIFNKTVPHFAEKSVFVLGTTDYTAAYIISSAVNYIVGGILSYFLNKYWSFGNKEKSALIVLKFVGIVVVCYAIAYLGAKPLMELILKNANIASKWKEFLALIVGAGLYTVLNYFGQRFFAFAKKRAAAQPEIAATQATDENPEEEIAATEDTKDGENEENNGKTDD